MKCPHCTISFHDAWTTFQRTDNNRPNLDDADGDLLLSFTKCPACGRFIVKERNARTGNEAMLRPKSANRPPPSPDVTEPYAEDYREACLVLSDSPKASAALSRRCLQSIIRDELNVNPANLSAEIDELLASGKLPSYVSSAIDAIRNIGNFSAHPMKDTNTGEIIDVEPGEAEWCLDVLEALFDFCFVQPALLAKKRAAVDEKLADADKPPMKT